MTIPEAGAVSVIDGVDPVTIITNDVEPFLSLYVGLFGFEISESGLVEDSNLCREVWFTPGAATLSAWLLTKPGNRGGRIRIVLDPSAPSPPPLANLHRAGPYAMDFYVRDLRSLHVRLLEHGHTFRSEPVEYQLFGQGFAVREVLLNAPMGLAHALIDYLPARHRCLLSDNDETVSETVAVVHVVSDLNAALDWISTKLGGEIYMNETFAGSETEQLMALPSGSRFRMALVRGHDRRNARIEFMQQSFAEDSPSTPRVASRPSVVLTCPVPEIGLARQLALSASGVTVTPVRRLTVPGSRGLSCGVRTPWGVTFEFVQRDIDVR